jgi:hypothetical protein
MPFLLKFDEDDIEMEPELPDPVLLPERGMYADGEDIDEDKWGDVDRVSEFADDEDEFLADVDLE